MSLGDKVGTGKSEAVMIGIGANATTVRASLAVALLGVALAFPPSTVHAACAQWDVGQTPEWWLYQDNGFVVSATFQQHGTQLRGRAESRQLGEIEGTIDGNRVNFTVRWWKGGTGVYAGAINDDGRMSGETAGVGWTSQRGQAVCLDFCNSYADDAVAQATKNKQMKCGLEKENADRWTLNRDDHFNWCLAQEGVASAPTSEGLYRINGLKDCAEKQEAMREKLKQEAMTGKEALTPEPKIGDILKETKPPATPPAQPPAGGNTATVIADVDVYNSAGGGGKRLGVLRSNNKTTKVSVVAPCTDNWCHVKGDPVPTGDGWVYSGTPPDFQSLQF